MAIPIMAVAAVAQAGVSISNAISGTSDAAKKRTYEQNLQLLNADDKKKLEKLLIEADSEQARQQILSQTLSTASSARINALAKLQAEKEKTKKTLLVVLIGGVILLGGIALILSKRRK